MTLPLEDDSRPPYLQAAEVLRARIHTGEYPAGSRLPSARILQAHFGVSSSTVQNALRVLKREGMVYSVLGRGSYVCSTHPGLPPAAPTEPSSLPNDTVNAEHDPRAPYVRTADLLREEIRSGNRRTRSSSICRSRKTSRNSLRPGRTRPPTQRPVSCCGSIT
ncbi:winged helix-turn-helix domain-containing protein [Streptomyces sp. NPDC002676]